jgi:hypothetical protein
VRIAGAEPVAGDPRGEIRDYTPSRDSESTLILQLHNSAHIDNLPVQAIEGSI